MKKKISFAFILAMILLLVSIATAVAGAVNEDFNTWLYGIWPEAAMKLMPVDMSCENKGIRMEVISAVNEGSQVYVTFSMQDLEGDRITRNTTADVSAQSGSINTSFSQTAEPLYQPDNKTMVFGWRIRFDDNLQEHKTLTFSVDSLIPDQIQFIDLLPLYRQYAAGAKTMPVPENASALRNARPDEIRQSGPAGSSDPDSLPEEDLAFLCYANGQETDIPEGMRVLDNHSALEIPLTEDVALSGIGMVDGQLHVQIHMFSKGYHPVNPDHDTGYWINMYDAAADKIFTSRARYTDPDKLPNGISEILWNESLKNGRKEYWREWIFAVDTEPTEAQKLHAEIHTYNGSVDGPWQADIPLRLIRKSHQ